MNSDHPYRKERQRVELLAEKYEALFSLITSSVFDQHIKFNALLCLSDLEKLIIQSPEYIYNKEFKQLKFAIFGDENSGWQNVLSGMTEIGDGSKNLKPGIRLKSEKILSDNSECLLIIRHEGIVLNSEIFDWADCGIFSFDLNDRQTLNKALKNRKKFNPPRKDNRNYLPIILVGCRDTIPNNSSDWNFYTNMKQTAVENNFDEYFEFQKLFSSDNSFLFEYCVHLAHKCRNGFNPMSESTDMEEKEIIFENISRNRRSKRKTDIINNIDDGVSKKKRFTIGGTLVRSFSIKNVPTYDYSKDKIVKQGTILKNKSSVILTLTVDGKLYYNNSKSDFEKKIEPKFIDLIVFSPKIPGNNFQNGYTKQNKSQSDDIENSLKLEIYGQGNKGKIVVHSFKTANENDQRDWMEKIIKAKNKLISQIVIVKQDMLANQAELLNEIRNKYSNNICAECSAENPNWIVYNFGILVCDRCSGDHRNLGVEYIKIGSMTLDGLDNAKLKILESFGNCLVNSVMEAKLLLTDDKKPRPGEKSILDWLKNKYVCRKYVLSVQRIDDIDKQLVSAITNRDRRRQLICLVNATTKQLNRPFSDDDFRTPLMIATCFGDLAVVQLLLWKHVDISLKDKDGNDVFHYARKKDNSSSMEIQKLLERYKIQL